MGYEHLSITPETEVTESNAENLLPIPSECEVTLEDKRECDKLVCKNSSTIDVCDNHSDTFSDSKIDDDISVFRIRNQVTIRTMMCQPMDHNIEFSGSNQIQNPQYPDVQENPLTNDEFEAFMKANDDKMNDLEIKFDQFQKQCEQIQDDLLNQMRNFMQNVQNGPPGEDKEHEKQKMEDTMFDLVKICHHKQFLCIHDDVDDSIESALDSKLLSINSIKSQRLDKKEQEVKNVEEQPAERGNLTESNAENLLPIPSECEVTSEDKRECDELICDNHSATFSDSKIDDDISVYDD
nr:hypothetical protein [Tanacetum cinerariifolium]